MKSKEEISKELDNLYREFKEETLNNIIESIKGDINYNNNKTILGYSIVVLEVLEDLEKEYRFKDLEGYLGIIYLTNFYNLYNYIEEEDFSYYIKGNIVNKIREDIEELKEDIEDLVEEFREEGLGDIEYKIYNLIDNIIYNN